jgi:hypothetical protein
MEEEFIDEECGESVSFVNLSVLSGKGFEVSVLGGKGF